MSTRLVHVEILVMVAELGSLAASRLADVRGRIFEVWDK